MGGKKGIVMGVHTIEDFAHTTIVVPRPNIVGLNLRQRVDYVAEELRRRALQQGYDLLVLEKSTKSPKSHKTHVVESVLVSYQGLLEEGYTYKVIGNKNYKGGEQDGENTLPNP